MQHRLDFIHIELDTGLILMRMASIAREVELTACAERIRNMAGKAHRRAAQHLEKLPEQALTASDREALLLKMRKLKESMGERASGAIVS